MFPVKQNVLQTVALLKAYGIQQVVLSPGSRNAPLIQAFSQDDFFKCHLIVDERNAAFYALGVIQCLQQPVAICCTSGSALQNYAPAVSEAFYQQLPLVIVSADRSPEWIGQMDGQTIPQPGIFGTLVKKAVNLPEVKNETQEWYCNRLVNEALMACTAQAPGPVHINVPLSEPLFDYSVAQLPTVRRIQYVSNDAGALAQEELSRLTQAWAQAKKPMIVVGQSFQSLELTSILEQLVQKTGCVVLCEHLSNGASPLFISSFDALLQGATPLQMQALVPDLLITFTGQGGGHIVSKRFKKFVRDHQPQSHWHISLSGDVVDLFQTLTHLIKTQALTFFKQLLPAIAPLPDTAFHDQWKNVCLRIPELPADVEFSDPWVIGQFLKALPENSALQVANSSAVRVIQLFPLKPSIPVYSNRGVNGIEGSLPVAVGYASVYQGNVYLLIGDLSFFYALSALWNLKAIKNLRILLLNNGGGGIFHQLPGLNQSASLNQYVAAHHETIAQDWAKAAGFECLMAGDKKTFSEHLQTFTSNKNKSNILLEVCTQTQINQKVYQAYDQQLKAVIQHDKH